MTSDLCFASARVLAQRIRSREVTAREVMQAHLNDEPGPYLKELTEPFSVRHLMYYE